MTSLDIERFAALRCADKEWCKGIRDSKKTKNFQEIQKYIYSVGSRRSYKNNGDFQWCGAYVAYCYSGHEDAIGIHPLLRRLFASTYKLYLYGHYRSDENIWKTNYVSLTGKEMLVKDWHSLHSSRRMIQFPARDGFSWDPQPGDIATVNASKRGPWGKHIVLVEGYEPVSDGLPGFLSTFEGNGIGYSPEENSDEKLIKWEGVVRNERSLDSVQMVVRPSLLDFKHDTNFVEGTRKCKSC